MAFWTKLWGTAVRLINASGILEYWNDIRNVLINNFADHPDETTLSNDLCMQTQGQAPHRNIMNGAAIYTVP